MNTITIYKASGLFNLVFLLILFFNCSISLSQTDTNNTDAISGATPTYYEQLSKDELFKIIKESDEAHVLSTTNADRTPNAAYMQPNIVNDSTILFYIAKEAITRINIDERKYAYFSFYIKLEDGTNWKNKYKGGRMLLKKIEDKNFLRKLNKDAKVKDIYSGQAVFLKIIKIIPFS